MKIELSLSCLSLTYRESLRIIVGLGYGESGFMSHKLIWKNGSFRNRENLLYKKTADSVLLSLFMRINAKCNNSHAPKWYSAFCQNPIFLKDQNMKKYQHYIDVWGVLPIPHGTTTALVTSK